MPGITGFKCKEAVSFNADCTSGWYQFILLIFRVIHLNTFYMDPGLLIYPCRFLDE